MAVELGWHFGFPVVPEGDWLVWEGRAQASSLLQERQGDRQSWALPKEAQCPSISPPRLQGTHRMESPILSLFLRGITLSIKTRNSSDTGDDLPPVGSPDP